MSLAGWSWCVLWAEVLALLCSDVGTGIIEIYAALVFVIIWAVAFGVRWLILRTGHRRRLVEAGVFAILSLAAYSGAFGAARLLVSMPALTRYAGDVRAGRYDLNATWTHTPRWVGLYRVVYTDMDEGAVRMITSSHGLIDQAGLVYSPVLEPRHRNKNSYRHMLGSWWRWVEYF